MPDSTDKGIVFPTADDFIKHSGQPAPLVTQLRNLAHSADNAISAEGSRIEGMLEGAIKTRSITELPNDVLEWVGIDKGGIYPIASQLTVDEVVNRPPGTGLAIVTIEVVASGGNLITWSEYGGGQRVWKRTVSSTPGRQTGWRLLGTPTRRVIHQLTMPGAPTLTDSEQSRHVRLPIKLPTTVNAWSLTIKNFNERSMTRFGELDFREVYIAPRAQDAEGNYTANFATSPVSLGTPHLTGSPNTSGRRYVIQDIGYTLEAGVEYILSYAYTDNDSSPNHLGIGGSYNGTNPAGVASMSVANEWSQYTPLDVYLHLEAPETTPTMAFLGSSSETGLHSEYPLRDSWAWKVAESRGALPIMLGQSGQTLNGFATGFVWTKVLSAARVDEAWLCAGSNDIYGGASLTVMQSRHLQVADRIRDRLSDNVVGVDIFPRAAETQPVKEVREAYNNWLRSLPNGLITMYDRVSSLTDENGLLSSEYNSGDDVHLNNRGQRVLAGNIINPSIARH